MINKVTIFYFFFFVALAFAVKRDGKVTSNTCRTPGSAAACDTLCWVTLPYFNDYPFRTGCLDSDGLCWCCDPRLTYHQSSSYGSYGYQTYACPDEPGCNDETNCHLMDWYIECDNLENLDDQGYAYQNQNY